MKTTRRCPKCAFNRILYIAHVADRYGETSTSENTSTPMRVAHYRKQVGSLFGLAMSTTERAGEVEAAVCRRCGYTELYVKDPGNIIVDGANVIELVGA